MHRHDNAYRRTRRVNGFTLVELLVVIVIIGLLAALVGTNVIGHIDKAKVTTTRAQIKNLHDAVNLYKLDTGRYPDSLLDLVEPPADVSNWNEDGYLEGTLVLPLDAWNGDFYYEYPGQYGKFDIWSLGADHEEGGDGFDADLYNSDVEGVTNADE